MTLQRWDIFCRIVDNYGDIGVCWRLARQLADEYQLSVRLWVDDMRVAARLIEGLDTGATTQSVSRVEIRRWDDQFPEIEPGDVVIEAFACELPSSYLQAMTQTRPVWINLEYLSAEDWVESFHAQLSIQPQSGLKKYFYFPGFTNNTGGLLREIDILQQRDTFLEDAEAKTSFLQDVGIQTSADQFVVSLFCYPHAPLQQLLDDFSQSDRPVVCLVPDGAVSSAVRSYFTASENLARGQLAVKPIRFLQQQEYDRLLWACDLNFVRGEDSWVRAIWSGKPFVWQPYQQNDDVHLQKLEAFLKLYAADEESPLRHIIEEAHHAWLKSQSGCKFSLKLWNQMLTHISSWNAHAQQRSRQFAERQDLAAKLVIFCQNKV